MQGFLLNLLVAAVKNKEIREFLFQLVDRLAPLLLTKLAAIIPAAVGAGIKGLGDIIPNIAVPALHEITEDIRGKVNELLPADIDIPILSDAFEGVTGFDLTEWLKTL